MKKILVALVFVNLAVSGVFAQRKKQRERQERSPRQELVYDNHQYLAAVRTVRLHPSEQENAMPIIELHSDEQLELSFDDLRADVRNFYFSLEHCTPEWTPSRLNQLEYAHGFNEDRIVDFYSSVNTLQPYTHYKVFFPTEHVKPRLPGNYLLKVYEDADKTRLILTRKFYVVTSVIPITADFVPSVDIAKRNQNQKINLSLNTGGITINNPYQDIKIAVMQNQRPDVQEWLTTPMFINQQTLTYNNTKTLDFGGLNEFRYIDLRSMRLASERVAYMNMDSVAKVTLLPDQDFSQMSYASVFDEDGAFFVRNQDRNHADTESEYIEVSFTMPDPAKKQGEIYIVGAFNQYTYADENRMTYDAEKQQWKATLLLKQGLYDYEYSMKSADGIINPAVFTGHHFETGNVYQVLVYVRRPGTTWDELLGYAVLHTENKK